MDPRLQIAPDVEAILDHATLSDAVAKREHTELGCASCGLPIPPELDAPASLLLVRAGEGRYLVCFAHAACADSQVVDAPGATGPPLGSVTWTPVLRERVEPRAALLVELHDYVAGEPLAAALPSLAPVSEAVGAAAAPALEGASVTFTPGAMELRLPGHDAVRLDEASAVFPDGWHEAARGEARLLLLAGTGMGLDRPDAARIDEALQLGRVAGAEVPVATASAR